MTGKLMVSLREAPSTVPALLAIALFIVWSTDQAGYQVTRWAPGALIVLALLVMTLALVRVRMAAIGLAVRVALGALAAYTVLSFLSILWARVPGDAWEGANRTLLYLLVFALFACWRQQARSATLLLVVWVLAMAALALYTDLHLDAASTLGLQTLAPGGRLQYPSGYPNANAAQWLMALWPALLLARSERLAWGLRGLLAASAVLLAGVALLSQSRGSLYATPVMLVLVFALLPGRARTFALLVPVGAGIGAAAPAVLRVADHLHNGEPARATVHAATTATYTAAVVVGLVVALAAAFESHVKLSEGSRRRIHVGVCVVALATLLAVLAGGLLAGNPVARVKHGWDTFKGGYASDSTTGSRLVGGLGSNRYDFYRVALDEFLAHPLDGIGADNFQLQYLEHGRSDETPHYPHSVELRTLSETGLLGALLALVGLGAAVCAVARVLRGPDPLARSVAAAAVSGFAYWVVHGSFDWFWEFAGLGGPAFALLGLACALASSRSPAREQPLAEPERPAGEPALAGGLDSAGAGAQGEAAARAARGGAPRRGLGRAGIALGALLALAMGYSLAAPWLSQLELNSAARIWTRAPLSAYARLRDAARMNPLSDEADVVAGTIALRYGDLTRANHDFELALERTPSDAYAALEQGAIASHAGRRDLALRLLEHAVKLEPREPLARQALRLVRHGGHVSVEELNRAILLKARQLA